MHRNVNQQTSSVTVQMDQNKATAESAILCDTMRHAELLNPNFQMLSRRDLGEQERF